MKRSFPLHIHISTLFVLLILVVGGAIGSYGYKVSRAILEATAAELTRRLSHETLTTLQQVAGPAEMATTLLRFDDVTAATTLKDRWQRLGVIRQALDESGALSSLYVGYDTGDFFFVRRIRTEDERLFYKAPDRTRYVVQSIERSGAGSSDTPLSGHYFFLDSSLDILRDDTLPDYAKGYDPRTRAWYTEAMRAIGEINTQPYLFFSDHKVGMTLAIHAANGHAVIAADIRLDTLSNGLSAQKMTPSSQILLVNADGGVVADDAIDQLVTNTGDKTSLPRMDALGVPVLSKLAEPIRELHGRAEEFDDIFTLADGDWRTSVRPMQIDGGAPLYLVIATPDTELLASASRLGTTSLVITFLIILIATPTAWLLARAIATPLQSLVGEAEDIQHFDFSSPVTVHSWIKEVRDLAMTMAGMKRTIRRFLDISRSVASEDDFDRLLPKLLGETLSAADAEIGVLYLVDTETLHPAAAMTADGIDLISTLSPCPLPAAGPLIRRAISQSQPQVEPLGSSDITGPGLIKLLSATPARHAAAVPLINRHHQLVGVMLLLRTTPIDDAQLSFITALSGSAATSIETRELIKAQRELFEAFIQLIASAIDAKSPYTGGHCARVPELTKMLARAACDERTGPYKDFSLNDNEWEAVHMASWLHDCGKVTTPEFIVDKATKLETKYDRIHEIRMRFEVLKRDAEITYYKAIAGGIDEAAAREKMTDDLNQLDDDFTFVAACNQGGEYLGPDKIARLQAIASRTWIRTLNDRIGLSSEEKERKDRVAAPDLPAVEPLIGDKPEHIIHRRPQDRMPDDNKWGFKLTVPDILYNHGELYNLSVSRGTLSEEERYKINEHIVQTLIMLSQLPFPKHLRQVPEIAGGHHEKMDGTGYPKRLTRDEMSPVARMMAIADIFEALTAVDRPYKKGKTLSEALKIMAAMKKDNHIDPDLFDLFLRSGIYRDYAERFMEPEQLDAVDISQSLPGQAVAVE